ncbi:MAG: hypothetical protein ACOC1K_02355 [Nanoarchaeota archaeon]
MGIFKEEAFVIESIAKKQSRIYNDSIDNGYTFSTKNIPSEIKDLYRVINDFKKSDLRYKKIGNNEGFVRNREQWTNGVSLEIVIFWEIDEGYKIGTKYTITYNKINSKHPSLIQKGNDSFISIEIKTHREKA